MGTDKESKGDDQYRSSGDSNDENTSGQQQHHQSKSKHPMSIRSPAEQKVIQERKKKLDDRAKQNWKKFGSRFRIPKVRAPRRSSDNEDDEGHEQIDDNNSGSNSEKQSPAHSSTTSSSSSSHIAAVDLPGTSFITLFCDDQKVPLPPTIVDILSKQGEKLVPDSISSLHEVARGNPLNCRVVLDCIVLL